MIAVTLTAGCVCAGQLFSLPSEISVSISAGMAQVDGGKTVNVVGDAPTYDRSSMLGNLMEEYEEDSMPLLWFNGIGEFWFWLIVSGSPKPG